ncbi:MAG: universal stress protein [Cyanothece sp. SIO2G6]|nr:universal stress protein [Cyanothece sp. SIO2G6]
MSGSRTTVQAPRIGQGRLLVLLRNPKTVPQLMRIARAIARDRQYEIDCLHILVVPRGTVPDESIVDTTLGRQLLVQVEQNHSSPDLSIHTHIRVTHDAAQATLEAIRDHHIDLVLLGWRGTTTASGRVFGDLVDTLIRQAPCDVMVVKLSLNPTFERWLMPVAGGPNVAAALSLLPSLVTLGKKPCFKTCQVFTSDKTHAGPSPAQEIAIALRAKLHCPVASEFVWNTSISEGMLELAWHDQTDVIVLGASREGLLQQAIKGNIPETIARRSMGTVILVRGATPPALS